MSYNLFLEAKEEEQCLINNIESIKKELTALPEGTLTLKICNNKKYYYHCHTIDKIYIQKYLDQSNSQLISDLKRKKFYQKCLIQMESNLLGINLLLNKYRPLNCSEILESLPKAYKGVPMNSINRVFPLHDWNNQPYKTNPHHPEHLIHTTSHGLKVRSKSEVIIADRLTANRIPFKYEALLLLDGKTLYPDFTILSPRDNKVYYWEHFGIHNNSYNNIKEQKLKLLNANNITPWTNLITSYDDTNGSISGLTIQNLINAFLL